jgi:hypothetical protein
MSGSFRSNRKLAPVQKCLARNDYEQRDKYLIGHLIPLAQQSFREEAANEAASTDLRGFSITASRDDGLCSSRSGDRVRHVSCGRRYVRDRHARG